MFASTEDTVGKKPKQFDFATSYSQAAVDKGGFKSLGDVVGLPDKEDWNNIAEMIATFCRETFYDDVKNETITGRHILTTVIANAKKEHQIAGYKTTNFKLQELGVVNEDAGGRHMFELPIILQQRISRAYPLMFTDKKHFAWFVRNFKELMIPERY